MSVPARSDSPLATSALSAVAANDGYGSLMGMGGSGGGARKKKKPVLVLDLDELEKAHSAIAMGGAQIMEDAVIDGKDEQSSRPPSSLLGLAPMGAEDGDGDDAAAYPPIPEAASWQEEGASGEGLPQLEADEDATDENYGEDLEEEEGDAIDLSLDLEHLLRPSTVRENGPAEQRESMIPSIEEQLKRMRAMPEPEPEPEPEAEIAAEPETRRAGPMEQLDESSFSSDGFSLSDTAAEPDAPANQPEFDDSVAAEPVPEEPVAAVPEETAPPAEMPEPEAQEFEFAPEEVAPADVEPEPEPEPEQAMAEHEPVDLEIADEFVEQIIEEASEELPEIQELPEIEADAEADEDEFDDGPDLSWMQPDQRRELHFAEGKTSQLRARMVHHDEELEEELPSGSSWPLQIWQRIKNWFASLRR